MSAHAENGARKSAQPIPTWKKIWNGVMVVCVLFVIGYGIAFALPEYFWLSIYTVQFGDSKAGKPAAVVITWTIRQDVRLGWSGHIRNVDPNAPDEGYVKNCDADRQEDVQPSDSSLKRTSIDWLLWPYRCRPAPGQYVATVDWTIDPWGLRRLHFRTVSNVFTVTP